MSTSKPPKPGRGFFSIDRRTWASICDRQDINLAVAYLTVASGTIGFTENTSWSALAVHKYTGMDRRVAGKTLGKLVSMGYLGHAKGHSSRKPRYSLTLWEKIAATIRDVSRSRSPMSGPMQEVLKAIRYGQQPSRQEEIAYAEDLYGRGWVDKLNGYYSLDFSVDAGSPGELIWLPNTLVVGTVKGEKSPVARLRAVQDVWTLRLLVDLYHSHDLPAHGGVRRDVVCQKFTKQVLGEAGSYAIWMFEPGDTCLWFRGALESHKGRTQTTTGVEAVCDSFYLLAEMGLVYCVPHLFESDSPDSGLIHGFGSLDGLNCEPEEEELRRAANHAGRHMADKYNLKFDRKLGRYLDSYCVPVSKTIRNVEMVGTYRLRYRPHTLLTSEWRVQLAEKYTYYLKTYEAMLPQRRQRPNPFA